MTVPSAGWHGQPILMSPSILTSGATPTLSLTAFFHHLSVTRVWLIFVLFRQKLLVSPGGKVLWRMMQYMLNSRNYVTKWVQGEIGQIVYCMRLWLYVQVTIRVVTEPAASRACVMLDIVSAVVMSAVTAASCLNKLIQSCCDWEKQLCLFCHFIAMHCLPCEWVWTVPNGRQPRLPNILLPSVSLAISLSGWHNYSWLLWFHWASLIWGFVIRKVDFRNRRATVWTPMYNMDVITMCGKGARNALFWYAIDCFKYPDKMNDPNTCLLASDEMSWENWGSTVLYLDGKTSLYRIHMPLCLSLQLARGNCFLEYSSGTASEATATPGKRHQACVTFGLRKFTGGLGDEDDDLQDVPDEDDSSQAAGMSGGVQQMPRWANFFSVVGLGFCMRPNFSLLSQGKLLAWLVIFAWQWGFFSLHFCWGTKAFYLCANNLKNMAALPLEYSMQRITQSKVDCIVDLPSASEV